jgi:heat shock protein HslJ
MKKTKISIVAVVAVIAAAIAAASAFAATAPLALSFAGRAVVVASGDSGTITVTGKGTSKLTGKATIAAKGTAFDGKPCATFFGTGTIKAADGSTIKFKGLAGSKVCTGADETKNAVNAKVTVNGGTKRFAKAKGTLTITGNYNRTAGTYTVKFSGKLTY